MTLKESISIILHEWNVQQKDQISKDVGSIKKVFPLKSNPGYIVKTFPQKYNSHTKREEEFCKNYPDLCAGILKVNYEKGYMIQERLDTKKFLDALYEVTGFIKKDLKKRSEGFENNTKKRWLEKMISEDDDQLEFFISYDLSALLWGFSIIEDLFPANSFAIKLLDFIHTLQKIQPNRPMFDHHQFNVGLDWEGNIKLLDL